MHEIVLNGYTAHNSNSRCLHFGTAESYGIEQIHITPGADWENLLIKATFHPPSGEAVTALIGEDGVIDVPPEATAVPAGEYNPGVIVFSGVADGVQRISANLAYTVIGHAPVEGKESEPTPSQWEQLAEQYQSKVDKQQGSENAGKILGIGEDGLVKPVEQTSGGGAGNNGYVLTEADKQEIAGMVEVPGGGSGGGDYTLPVATETALGGVKAIPKTEDMTQRIGIDADGFLYTTPGSGGGGSSDEELPVIETITPRFAVYDYFRIRKR